MVLKYPPTIKTELEDKETRQESESIILRSNKNQIAVVQTHRITKYPPSTEVRSTSPKANIIIRRPAKNNHSSIEPAPTKKNKSHAHIDPCCTCGYKSKYVISQRICKAVRHACQDCTPYCCRKGIISITIPVDLSLYKTPPPRPKRKAKQRNLATLANESSPTKS